MCENYVTYFLSLYSKEAKRNTVYSGTFFVAVLGYCILPCVNSAVFPAVCYSNSEPVAVLYSGGVDPLTLSSNCVRINCICIIHRCINTTNTRDAPVSYCSVMGET